jgi:hypothetical protein
VCHESSRDCSINTVSGDMLIIDAGDNLVLSKPMAISIQFWAKYIREIIKN